jgi:hypothetical protein
MSRRAPWSRSLGFLSSEALFNLLFLARGRKKIIQPPGIRGYTNPGPRLLLLFESKAKSYQNYQHSGSVPMGCRDGYPAGAPIRLGIEPSFRAGNFLRAIFTAPYIQEWIEPIIN